MMVRITWQDVCAVNEKGIFMKVCTVVAESDSTVPFGSRDAYVRRSAFQYNLTEQRRNTENSQTYRNEGDIQISQQIKKKQQ